jgi:NAD(P)-dependent dehydrogenase (short-subunit alcohol dehydrogenase family)
VSLERFHGVEAHEPMSTRLAGRVALVTGGGRGIGRAIALALAQAGADVIPTARTLRQIESVSDEIAALGRRSLAQSCDVSQISQIQSLLTKIQEDFGRLDILIHAAAISPLWKRIEDLTEEEWDAVLDVNVKGAFLVSREVGRVMIAQGGGSIVHLTSIAGLRGTSHIGAYSVSKAALIGLTRVLAYEWVKYHIRVNAIAPGWVRTELTQPVFAHPEISKSLLAGIPQRRFADPEEIAPLAVYLASDDAKFVTGQVYIIDGGQTL